ncbi:MAG: metal-dependent transcriptional regulator [Clostridium sp.]|nr:metal-dependent transcriptional regulator [Clostridium sp.]
MKQSQEDYLKALYDLGGEKYIVTNKDLAHRLNVSPPSVSEMLRKLFKQDYIDYEKYKGIRLTEEGVKAAEKIKRSHHLWEVFLIEKLGFKEDEVHEEAEKLEHVTSIKLQEALDQFLGYPEKCPHGTKINRE